MSLVFQLELAVIEAGNNIVLHAYQKQGNHFFHMEFSVTQTEVQCTFTDQGIHKDFLKDPRLLHPCKEPASLEENHRGVSLICDIMDTVSYIQKGNNNILTISKRLPAA